MWAIKKRPDLEVRAEQNRPDRRVSLDKTGWGMRGWQEHVPSVETFTGKLLKHFILRQAKYFASMRQIASFQMQYNKSKWRFPSDRNKTLGGTLPFHKNKMFLLSSSAERNQIFSSQDALLDGLPRFVWMKSNSNQSGNLTRPRFWWSGKWRGPGFTARTADSSWFHPIQKYWQKAFSLFYFLFSP